MWMMLMMWMIFGDYLNHEREAVGRVILSFSSACSATEECNTCEKA